MEQLLDTQTDLEANPWPLNAQFTEEGLIVAGCTASEIVHEFGTPVLVVDEADFRHRCAQFATAFSQVAWAVKSFPVQALARIAYEEGLELLVSTEGELDTCLRAGVPGSSIIMHGNNKSTREIEAAMRCGVALLTVDNLQELELVASMAEEADHVQPILIRITPGVDVDTHAYIATGHATSKFGLPISEGLAALAIDTAQRSSHLNLRGVHVHLGSQLLTATPYLQAICVVMNFLSEVRRSTGFTAEVLDLGGGYGVTYEREERLSIPRLAATLQTEIASVSSALGLPIPELIVEPGRVISAGACVTLYEVGHVKAIPHGETYVAVDGGMSDNIRPALYGAHHEAALASRRSQCSSARVSIVGKHCETGDVLRRHASAPSDLIPGDLLAMATTGAYTYAMSSNYNKVPRPPVVLAREGRTRLIVRRETFDDLAARDLAPSEHEGVYASSTRVK